MTADRPIYMDCHATTPVDPRVVEAMLPCFTETFGNPGSRTHVFGWKAEEAVDIARQQVAALIGTAPKDIIFTSGATEADNLAVKGIAAAFASRGRRIVTQVTEHHAVLDACTALKRQGYETVILPVDGDGRIDLDQLADALTDDTILVSIMSANNEIGVLQPVDEIGALCRERDVPFHSDATQSVGKLPLNVTDQHIDLLSLTAHKLYGPKGAGALYVRGRPRIPVVAQMDGGGHERGLRSGTLNVPGIVGLGKACEIAGLEMETEGPRVRELRDRLHKHLASKLDGMHLNGHAEHRLDGNLNVSFEDVDGEALLMGLSDIALSSGAACTSASLEPSYVLRALGLSDRLAQSSIRFGIGRFNTAKEIDIVADRVIAEVRRLRKIAPSRKPVAR